MRTRTRSYQDPVEPTHVDTWWTYGTCANRFALQRWPSSDENGTVVPYEWTETMHDLVTDHWFRRCRNGEIINNPYDKVRTETHRQSIAWYESRFIYTMTTMCGGGSLPILTAGERRVGTRPPEQYLGTAYLAAPTLDVERLKNLATTGAYAKANEQDVQGLVVLAEGEKTIKSFISIGKRLIRLGRALRKWDVRYLRKQLSARELADRWMEGRYAIRPVVYDMLDCVKALKRDRAKQTFRQTYRSGANDSGTASQSGVITYTNSNYYTIRASKTTTRIVSARSGVLSAIDAISEATIWGLDQPFSALWELVPFSFVVDWFFNVGKTIAAWSPRQGIRTLASWVTVKDTVSQGIFCEGAFKGTWTNPLIWEWDLSSSGGFLQKVTQTTQRFPTPNLPILPTFSVRLDAAKLLDLAIMGRRLFR